MKLDFLKIKKSFKKRSSQPNSDLYWRMILGIAISVVIAGFTFAIYQFVELNKNFSNPTSDETTLEGTLKRERVEKVMEYFSKRAEKSENIKNSASPIIDPSL